MRRIQVPLKKERYDIIIGRDILARVGPMIKRLEVGRDAVVVTNPAINTLYGKKLSLILRRSGFSVRVLTVTDSERSKSIGCATRLLTAIARGDVRKKIFLIALGGGVIGDLTGFVAAVYKRGVPYIQIPTTFLAQIDSAIGGKTAVDLPVAKNLIGSFYQPRLVVSDVSLLRTLSSRQVKNGLAEAVKYGAIRDRRLFAYIEKNYTQLLAGNTRALEKVVVSCSAIKAQIVGCDEREARGIRTILNFGHTIGHAIETAGGYRRYHHGEAVALGMRVAAAISCAVGLCGSCCCQRLEELLSAIGLPERIERLSASRILEAMGHDKKFTAGKNRFVLLSQIGVARVVEGVPASVVKKAVNAYLNTCC